MWFRRNPLCIAVLEEEGREGQRCAFIHRSEDTRMHCVLHIKFSKIEREVLRNYFENRRGGKAMCSGRKDFSAAHM
jgi:hypothetical protein